MNGSLVSGFVVPFLRLKQSGIEYSEAVVVSQIRGVGSKLLVVGESLVAVCLIMVEMPKFIVRGRAFGRV